MECGKYFFDSKLPGQLSDKEIEELFNQVQAGSKEAKDKIITHNIRLVIYLVKNYDNIDYDKEDLVSIGVMGLIKAVDTYNQSKGSKFATYASICIKNEINMFLRKLSKCQNTESLENEIAIDSNGNGLRIEEVLCDENDFILDIEKEEENHQLRKTLDILNEREKDMISLHFGLYDGKIYTQQEIAEKYNITQTWVCKLIKKNIEKLKIELLKNGFASNDIYINKGDNNTMRHVKTLYENLNEYTKEEIDKVISNLTDEDKKLLKLRYGDDLSNPVTTKLDKTTTGRFYGYLIPKIKNSLKVNRYKNNIDNNCSDNHLVNNITNIDNKEIENNNCIDDYEKLIGALNTPAFTQMVNTLSVKESIIISLRLGYVDGKFFSADAIANFLGISKDEVFEATSKALLFYKDSMNTILDNLINYMSNDASNTKYDKTQRRVVYEDASSNNRQKRLI